MRYVCSDLHGCYDEFLFLLKKINFTDDDIMYLLGDNVDRGEQSMDLLKFIYEHDNVISILGNHELFLINYISGKVDKNLYLSNGGSETLREIRRFDRIDPILCKNILDDLSTWKYYIIIDNFILTHAGYDGMKLSYPSTLDCLNEMTSKDFVWSRDEFFTLPGIEGYITVFGHTPTSSIRKRFDQPETDDIWIDEYYKDKIGIDGGIVFDGQINCLNLDTMDVIIVTSDDYWDSIEPLE